VDVFELAACLHEFKLIGPYPPKLLLPWSQLTAFNNENCDGCGLRSLFRDGSSTVKTLEITRYSHVPLVPPATLPVLYSLRVVFGKDTNGIEQFLNNLTPPAIQDIGIFYPGQFLPCLISMMFSRSQPPHTLQKLAFYAGYATVDQLLTPFTQLPRLIELDIMLPINPGEIYRIFHLSSTPQILPSLQVLMFRLSGTIGSVAEICNDIAQSRFNPTATSNERTPVNVE
jgi:hypothetical protein